MFVRSKGLVAQMSEEGFRPGAPGGIGSDIDAGVCADSTCEACGHVGMTYVPFLSESHRRSTWSGRMVPEYRAFAVCPACGHEVEF